MKTTSKVWMAIAAVELCYIGVSTSLSISLGWDSFQGEILKSAARVATLVVYGILFARFLPQKRENGPRRFSVPLVVLAVLLTIIPSLISVRPQERLEWMVLFSLGSFLVGFREELLYRVLIQSALVKKWSPVMGILVTSVLFSLYHVSYFMMGSWLAVGEVFLFSLVIGVLYLVSRSYVLVAAIHSFYDLLFIANPLPNQVLPEVFVVYLLVVVLIAAVILFRKDLTRPST